MLYPIFLNVSEKGNKNSLYFHFRKDISVGIFYFFDLLLQEFPALSPASSTNGRSPAASPLKPPHQLSCVQPERATARFLKLLSPGPSLTAAWLRQQQGRAAGSMLLVSVSMMLMILIRSTIERNIL